MHTSICFKNNIPSMFDKIRDLGMSLEGLEFKLFRRRKAEARTAEATKTETGR